MSSTSYLTGKPLSGDLHSQRLTCAADAYYVGMPLKYNGDASVAAGDSDTGNGTLTVVSVSKETPVGDHVITFSDALAADYVGPNDVRKSIALTDGDTTNFNINGIFFAITDGSTAFVDTDSFTVSVSGDGAYEYDADKPEVIAWEEETLSSEGRLLCAVSGSEVLKSGIVDDSDAALTLSDDAIAYLRSNGVVIRNV